MRQRCGSGAGGVRERWVSGAAVVRERCGSGAAVVREVRDAHVLLVRDHNVQQEGPVGVQHLLQRAQWRRAEGFQGLARA